MQKIKALDYMSFAKLSAVLGLVGGVLSGISLMGLFGVMYFVTAVVTSVIGGAIGGVIFVALYNYVLKDKLAIEAEV